MVDKRGGVCTCGSVWAGAGGKRVCDGWNSTALFFGPNSAGSRTGKSCWVATCTDGKDRLGMICTDGTFTWGGS